MLFEYYLLVILISIVYSYFLRNVLSFRPIDSRNFSKLCRDPITITHNGAHGRCRVFIYKYLFACACIAETNRNIRLQFRSILYVNFQCRFFIRIDTFQKVSLRNKRCERGKAKATRNMFDRGRERIPPFVFD